MTYRAGGGGRVRGYTPRRDAERAAQLASAGLQPGGAAAFLQFLTGELAPWVGERYAVRADATLAGYLPARVFMSVGALEEATTATMTPEQAARARDSGKLSNFDAFVAQLGARDYPSLELTTQVFDGETHLSGSAASLIRGLRVVLGDD